jgi:alpha-galactosidase
MFSFLNINRCVYYANVIIVPYFDIAYSDMFSSPPSLPPSLPPTQINIDDCWASSRDAQGNIVADPTTFPSGIRALADYVNSKGLLLGIYSSSGGLTCAGRPASLTYEKQDAQSFADWHVSYLKYDNCNTGNVPVRHRYKLMRDALNATGRHIFFSMCEWGADNPATWAPDVGNSWRTTGDIRDNFWSMIGNIHSNDEWAKYAAPGGWNDPDMLEVGNGGMTDTEYRLHFSLWALAKAPLLIGCDLQTMSPETFDILTNDEIIAVNQDPLGVQGKRVNINGTVEVWSGPQSDGSVVACLVNLGSDTTTISASFVDMGVKGTTASVRDLWLHQDMGDASGTYTASVPPHGVVMVRLTPSA